MCYVEQLAAIPEFAHLGNLFKSSEKAVELTESETEYVVCCIKHTFQQHIVFQVLHFVSLSHCIYIHFSSISPTPSMTSY